MLELRVLCTTLSNLDAVFSLKIAAQNFQFGLLSIFFNRKKVKFQIQANAKEPSCGGFSLLGVIIITKLGQEKNRPKF